MSAGWPAGAACPLSSWGEGLRAVSGARVLVTLVHQMIAKNAKTGGASLCIGGGEGIALLVERS